MVDNVKVPKYPIGTNIKWLNDSYYLGRVIDVYMGKHPDGTDEYIYSFVVDGRIPYIGYHERELFL